MVTSATNGVKNSISTVWLGSCCSCTDSCKWANTIASGLIPHFFSFAVPNNTARLTLADVRVPDLSSCTLWRVRGVQSVFTNTFTQFVVPNMILVAFRRPCAVALTS